MVVWTVTYYDERYPGEPIVTAFSNEEAARTMQEYVINNSTFASDVILDECRVYDNYLIKEG